MTTVNKLDKVKTTGIINIIDAFLCLAIGVAFLLCFKSTTKSAQFEDWEGLGAGLAGAIFLVFIIIAYVPIALHAVYKMIIGILSIVNAVKVAHGKPLKLGKGVFTANTVLRIITIIAFAIEAFLVYSIFDVFKNAFVGLLFAVFLVVLTGAQILAMIIDGGAKNQIKEYKAQLNSLNESKQ